MFISNTYSIPDEESALVRSASLVANAGVPSVYRDIFVMLNVSLSVFRENLELVSSVAF